MEFPTFVLQMFKKINIYEELVREKVKSPSLLEEANSILQHEFDKDDSILKRLTQNLPVRAPKEWTPTSSTSLAESAGAFFSLQQIKNIAVKYRLRFLDSTLFKGEIPYEAIIKVKVLERKYNVKFSEFKILAPASLFRLEDRNKDPLLFARISSPPIGGGVQEVAHYLLIHKWGNDLYPFRKVLAFPLRTIRTFIFTLLTLSLLVTMAAPVDYNARLFIFLLSNLFFLSMFAHIGYMRLNQNFSEFEWDSKFIS